MVFEDLNSLNVNEHTEKKNVSGKDLTYLSWPWAWAEVKKRYPDAHYTIWRNRDGLPYTVDPLTGYMVYTNVTIEGVTHEMWLPVMNGANRAMKPEPYEYKAGNYTKVCEAATMMDINKTIMRCLVKNLAMFGLGLYIYAGEDLPESADSEEVTQVNVAKSVKGSTVDIVNQLPKKEEPEKENPVSSYLMKCMADMREMRGITPKENNKLFKEQMAALVKAKLAPDKNLKEYTMDEAIALIDAMYKCFDMTGTELKTK